MAVKNKSTNSGKTEIYVLDGATNYKTFLLKTRIILNEDKKDQFQYVSITPTINFWEGHKFNLNI